MSEKSCLELGNSPFPQALSRTLKSSHQGSRKGMIVWGCRQALEQCFSNLYVSEFPWGPVEAPSTGFTPRVSDSVGQRWLSGKESPCQCMRYRRCRFYTWVGKISWRKKLQPAPIFFFKKSFSHVWLFVTPWTVAYQAPQSTEFSRQEYWSGLPFPSPGDLPTPGSNLGLPHCMQTLYYLSHQGLQYSCLGNPMDREVWQATVHGLPRVRHTTEQLSTHADQTSLKKMYF